MKSPKSVVTELHRLRAEVSDRLARIRRDRRRADQPLSADFSEQAVERENDEVLDRLETATEADLRQMNHALERIQAGLYPQCEICGERVEMERLHALPFATTCAVCATREQTPKRAKA